MNQTRRGLPAQSKFKTTPATFKAQTGFVSALNVMSGIVRSWQRCPSILWRWRSQKVHSSSVVKVSTLICKKITDFLWIKCRRFGVNVRTRRLFSVCWNRHANEIVNSVTINVKQIMHSCRKCICGVYDCSQFILWITKNKSNTYLQTISMLQYSTKSMSMKVFSEEEQ